MNRGMCIGNRHGYYIAGPNHNAIAMGPVPRGPEQQQNHLVILPITQGPITCTTITYHNYYPNNSFVF